MLLGVSIVKISIEGDAVKTEFRRLVDDFLAQKVIAIVGHNWKEDDAACHIRRKLEGLNYTVVPVLYGGTEADGGFCSPSLCEAPGEIGAVMVTGDAQAARRAVEECVQRGIRLVWLHSALGTSPRRWMRKIEHTISSVGPEAVELARANGIGIIPGACPMMFREPVDGPHRFIRGILERLGCMEERVF